MYQHQVLPRLAYFQSSRSGQNNIITWEVAQNPVLCQISNQTFKSRSTSVVV